MVLLFGKEGALDATFPFGVVFGMAFEVVMETGVGGVDTGVGGQDITLLLLLLFCGDGGRETDEGCEGELFDIDNGSTPPGVAGVSKGSLVVFGGGEAQLL